jgi:acyl dehydratase
MPLDASLVGTDIGRIHARVDARWLMAYASGVPDERPELYDTTGPLAAHPLFPVAPEWALLTTHRAAPMSMSPDETARGVHYRHDVVLERPVVAGDEVDVTARVIGVDRQRAGATQTALFRATDAVGVTVWQTRLTSLFVGVELVGNPARVDDEWPPTPADGVSQAVVAQRTSFVRLVDAHVYTECARIWNPIHTDVVVARRAGLDAPILHGTATLARAVSIATELAVVPLSAVRRVAGTFAAMVPLGSTITVRLLASTPTSLAFDVVTEAGQTAVRSGVVGLLPSPRPGSAAGPPPLDALTERSGQTSLEAMTEGSEGRHVRPVSGTSRASRTSPPAGSTP